MKYLLFLIIYVISVILLFIIGGILGTLTNVPSFVIVFSIILVPSIIAFFMGRCSK